MRSAIITQPRIPWRGLAAFALDNLIPLLGFTALVIGAFHLPGVWGAVGGWALAGISLIKIHDALADEIKALKELAKADRIEREHARRTAELEARRLRTAG